MDPAGAMENGRPFPTAPWTALRAAHRLHRPYEISLSNKMKTGYNPH